MSLTLYISFNPDMMYGERAWQALRLLWLGGAVSSSQWAAGEQGTELRRCQGEGAEGGRDIDLDP